MTFRPLIYLSNISSPQPDCSGIPVPITDETIYSRKKKVIHAMQERQLDVLVIYADLEHGSNFEYLTGFLPRFEEALLVLHTNGAAYLVLGNENINKAKYSRIPATPILCSYFSLPDQPMQNHESFDEILRQTQISGSRAGVVGWKLFRSSFEPNDLLFDLPEYIISALRKLCGAENIVNATDLMIGKGGVRRTNNANEIAHYEFGASLASDCILDTMDFLAPGVTEMQAGDRLSRFGQRNSVVTIAAFGERFLKANMYPTSRKLQEGDTVSLTVGYKGGLSSRAGIAVRQESELPPKWRDYLSAVAIPYFDTICTWLEHIHAGLPGGALWQLTDQVLPREQFHWYLCPGHLTADEEWLASPIYENSTEPIDSGMIFQTDIIPAVSGYPGISAESTCAIADAPLRSEIQKQYPELWERIQKRRIWITDNIGLHLHEDVLPMCSTLAYLRPFLLSRQALTVINK